ncbi:MAG: hypothetical protein ACREU4_12170, partial [Burkholderiales bacterium]
TIWDKHPEYGEDELRSLVRAAASALYDSADDRAGLDSDLFDAGPRSAARDLARELGVANAPVGTAELESLLGDPAAARTAWAA